jgi:hypothetical protein
MATAQIVEDRGTLSVHGRRLYRVRPATDHGEETSVELPEEEVVEEVRRLADDKFKQRHSEALIRHGE